MTIEISSAPRILPLRQKRMSIESVDRDEVWGSNILDWVTPDSKMNDWGLAGHGESKSSCGTFFMKACLNVDAHPDGLAVFKPHVMRCFSPLCPECWRSWLSRESERITYRIEEYQKRNHGVAVHWVVSVPQKDWNLPVSKLRSLAYRYAVKVGFSGGSSIWHPFRETDNGRWYFSPHFHLLGFGWCDHDAISKNFKVTGWIIKNIGIRKTVFGTAYYQLSHCGVWYGKGKHCSVSWFGTLSYSKLRVPKKDIDQVFCPYCRKPLVKVEWIGSDSAPLPCSGVGGFYLGSAVGWIDSLLEKYCRTQHDFFNS